jgi:hypothetical protein
MTTSLINSPCFRFFDLKHLPAAGLGPIMKAVSKLRLGSVFNVRGSDDPVWRKETRTELEWIEKELIRRRALLAKWERRAQRCSCEADIPEDLKEVTFKAHGIYKDLVRTGEGLRAMILAEIVSYPEYQPPYHHEN